MIDWIITKYKIWRYHRKFGKYHRNPQMSQEEYENFYVGPEDMEEVIDINRTNVVVQPDIKIPKNKIIFRNKK